jgi:hypothetical protein
MYGCALLFTFYIQGVLKLKEKEFRHQKVNFFLDIHVWMCTIIHILYTGCAEIKINSSGTERLIFLDSHVWMCAIIHVLYTECAKINKNNSGTERLNFFRQPCTDVHY